VCCAISLCRLELVAALPLLERLPRPLSLSRPARIVLAPDRSRKRILGVSTIARSERPLLLLCWRVLRPAFEAVARRSLFVSANNRAAPPAPVEPLRLLEFRALV
jgi:hypothetical protein